MIKKKRSYNVRPFLFIENNKIYYPKTSFTFLPISAGESTT